MGDDDPVGADSRGGAAGAPGGAGGSSQPGTESPAVVEDAGVVQVTLQGEPQLVAEPHASRIAELKRRIRAFDVAIAALDREAGLVESGQHPELTRRCAKLKAARERREASARKTHERELATLDKLHEMELAAARKQMERGVEQAREKLADQLAARAKSAETRRDGGQDDGVRMNTRSLRSKATGLNDDDGRPVSRRTAGRRGAQSPASMLLEKGLTEAQMEADFQLIAESQQDYRPAPPPPPPQQTTGTKKRSRGKASS